MLEPEIKKMIEDGKITLDGNVVKAGQSLKANQCIVVKEEEPKNLDVLPENIQLDIVYQESTGIKA